MSKIENIKFFSDHYRLHGILHLPNTSKPPLVIGCHGLFATSDSPKQIALAKQCCENGIAYFRFDHRGCGQSQGEFEKVTSVPARCKDLKSAIKSVCYRLETKHPIGLFGSSMGGTVCLALASEIKTGPIVVIAAPLSTHGLRRPTELEDSNHLHLSDRFYTNHLTFDIQNRLSGINNILIFHGDLDPVVPVSNAYQLYNAANQPKKLVIQKSGDHSMSNIVHQKEFQRESLRWIQKGFDL
jgi:alpha-beta hydrolase superfamily lysophospholipase